MLMKKILLLLTFICVSITCIANDYELLVNEVDTYIQRIAPTSKLEGKVVVDMCLKYDIDIIFVLAQGQAESHFGTTGTARKTNSVFNVGAYNGHSASKQISNGFGFKHPNDSVEPYILLLMDYYLVNKTTNDLLYNYVNIYNMRYASNLAYEKFLRSIYNTINKKTNINYYQNKLCHCI